MVTPIYYWYPNLQSGKYELDELPYAYHALVFSCFTLRDDVKTNLVCKRCWHIWTDAFNFDELAWRNFFEWSSENQEEEGARQEIGIC